MLKEFYFSVKEVLCHIACNHCLWFNFTLGTTNERFFAVLSVLSFFVYIVVILFIVCYLLR